MIDAANRAGGEDNITVVLFRLAESGPDEDTLSGLEGLELPEMPVEVVEGTPNGAATDITVVDRPIPTGKPSSGRGRAAKVMVITGGILLLFAGLAAASLYGLSRAHFVGATADGHVAVYQGVPWNLLGGAKLYREVYVSNLLTEQLSPEERQRLFDHQLTSESTAKARIAPYEQEANP